MPLDGLRAWIGELERKLGARTRIGLVLVALAIGGAGAGIYLALDAADNSVSKDDLQALQEQVGASAPELDSTASEAQTLAESNAAEIAKLKLQVKLLQAAIKSLAVGAATPSLGEENGGSSGTHAEGSAGAAK
jgi:uncharacterized protein HemX